MDASGTAPAPQQAAAVPVRTKVLHESERVLVTRVFLPGGGSVIDKRPLGPDAARRLRHERDVLHRLSGVEGITQLAEGVPAHPGSIMLADVGGTCLAERSTPLDIDELVDLAAGLARAVAGMHSRGVVHRDISPGNVVLARDTGAPYLIDFALATASAEIWPEFTHHTRIVGTLPYLAPEQTGRTGRPVDQRADLYALGATLYELATGEPPFGTGDPMRLTHDHLARVPTPPEAINPAVPPALSAIIMHLLEKEPDKRYQTAEALAHDLARLRAGAVALRAGEHDFPGRLFAPSRLVGRDAEIAALGTAFAEAMLGRCSGVLVSGAPGVGKSSLVDELRPIVTAADGWFVAGKFDQYRRDQEFDGVRQAFRKLGRLLLAEPEEELTELRERLLDSVGGNAALATAVLPEFDVLLGVPPDPGDPQTAQARVLRAAVDILRAVASRKRPVVLFIDDLQWASRTPLGLIDAVLSGAEEIEGLLLVGAYRDCDVDAAHPLAAMQSRWQRLGNGPQHLRLANLSPAAVANMVADMLRLDGDRADELARAIVPHAKGNPFDTVELLNALRHEGVLRPAQDGWSWDPLALQRRLPQADVVDLLATRIGGMPPPTRTTLEAMACLGGQVGVRLLRVATALPDADTERRLMPALGDGLLVLEPGPEGGDVVRFRHDRVQEAVLHRLTSEAQCALRLSLARRLAERPELFAVAAEQYLAVWDAVDDAAERQRMRELFRRAADEARLFSNYSVVERFLARAVDLTDPGDSAALIEVLTGRHAALYMLGRLDEADEVYRTIDQLCTHPEQRTDATVVQISSLTNQRRLREAVDLGIEQLRQIGLAVPGPDRINAEIDSGLDELYRWLEDSDEADELQRPEIEDPALLAKIALINRLFPPTFFYDQTMTVWMTLETLGMWRRHGPSRALIGPISHVTYMTIAQRGDYRTGYRIIQMILAVSRARGYEPETSHGLFEYVLSTGHWFEPLESTVPKTFAARDGLIQGGDLQNAMWNYYPLVYGLLDLEPTLRSFVSEVDAALGFAARTGNVHGAESIRAYRRVAGVMCGEPVPADEPDLLEQLAGSPIAAVNAHITRALTAALLDNRAELARHAAEAMPLLPSIEGQYPTAVAYLLRALALAGEVRASAAGTRGAVLAEVDAAVDWLAARAQDAPDNFLHLLRLVNAERAWAVGDFQSAARAYDEAQRAVAGQQRPWHRALILERSGRFYLAHGMDSAGYASLADARQQYLAWGATAKVNQLDWAYPSLHVPIDAVSSPVSVDLESPIRRSSIMTGMIDMLGILDAAQALSSETSIAGLRARVVEVLSAMTGATGVHLLLWDDDEQTWQVSSPDGAGDTTTLAEASRRRLLPVSVVRYAERTREPLVVADGTRDDRFGRDPYLSGLDRCSLLVVPILNRGALRAMLILENRLIANAFSTDRLDGVNLIAAQLAVSLDNALIYASLERKVNERTHLLALANERLEQLSITDPLTGLANRRRLEEVLAAEWRRAGRLATPVGLAMVDIDYFKLYNDHFGHTTGDRCLQRVAALLREHVRDRDLAARYGGEEFAIVMPDTDIDTTLQLAERLRAAVVALHEPHPLAAEGIVTVSVGAAVQIPQGGSVEHLVEAADVELYRAKRAGRNRVRATAPPAPRP